MDNIVSRAALTERMYRLSPIDFWDGWLTEEGYLRQLMDDACCATANLASYVRQRCRAETMARSCGWGGDMREGPYISALPSDCEGGSCEVMIAWKQDNNGETFVYSPYPLPWLEGR